MRSGRRPFRSTEARHPWKPSLEATSLGRLPYMPGPSPAMNRSPAEKQAQWTFIYIYIYIYVDAVHKSATFYLHNWKVQETWSLIHVNIDGVWQKSLKLLNLAQTFLLDLLEFTSSGWRTFQSHHKNFYKIEVRCLFLQHLDVFVLKPLSKSAHGGSQSSRSWWSLKAWIKDLFTFNHLRTLLQLPWMYVRSVDSVMVEAPKTFSCLSVNGDETWPQYCVLFF